MDKSLFSNHISLKNTNIDDEFWSKMQEKVRTKVIPYQYNALNDKIKNAEKSYCIDNFKKAKKVIEAQKSGITTPTYPVDKWHYDENNADKNAFHGWVFQDSDAYKWLEAVAYSLNNKWDDDLYTCACELIDLICSAQCDNGYLDTLYVINDQSKIFTNLKDFHELYCFGHLAEAAVAFYSSTKSEKLLTAALRFADLICDTFNENGKRGYPGHEIAELALVKLYKITGNEKYLKTAEFFINERGTKPYYFDIEQNIKTDGSSYVYNQAHMPIREQAEAVGHAVRGVYLYSGMADVAKETNDEELYYACKRLWNNITTKKMYITGGIGSTVDGEAFSFDYDLPNDLAYCETCASIGLMFFGMRMLEIAPNSQIADTMERALYNTILAGMNDEGDRFFYVNPLEVLPEASKKDSRKRHIKTVRQKWFGCACCPPNLARLISSIGEYCITENENTTYIHQFIGGKFKTNSADISIASSYTSNGRVSIEVNPHKPFTLGIRIPAWCNNYNFSQGTNIKNDYAYFDITERITINIKFDIEPKIIACSNLVRENIGKIAVTRGPFVYCLEEADNGKNLQMLRINTNSPLKISNEKIIANGFRQKQNEKLYFEFKTPCETETELTFIPYYKWGNRGENEMTVYIRY